MESISGAASSGQTESSAHIPRNPERSSQVRLAAHGDDPEALLGGDVRSTLATLNSRTRYRFTGLYRLDPPVLRNVCLFDRENPQLSFSGDIHLLADTYCSIVSATGEPFTTSDSRVDDRLAEHPARDRVISYFGIPLSVNGEVRGVLCHFDGRPRFAPEGERAFLESVEPTLAALIAD